MCRAAQEAAVRLALDLAPNTDAIDDEIRRDHLLRLAVILPRQLGMAPLPLESATLLDGLPDRPDGLDPWLRSGRGAAPLIDRLAVLFAPNVAAVQLPFVDDATAFDPSACVDNSVAARHATHPVMQAAEAHWGRGPAWRVLARLFDLFIQLPGTRRPRPGAALAPAARGLFAVTISLDDGSVASFARVTPTDHLMVRGGLMDLSLAGLAPDSYALAPLLVDILDPCSPVMLEGGDA